MERLVYSASLQEHRRPGRQPQAPGTTRGGAPEASRTPPGTRNDDGYDRKRALYPADVFAWLEATQPETLAKAMKPATAERDREALLDRLAKFLDAPFEASGGQQGGTLAVLRRGFTSVPYKFVMAQFTPVDDLNVTTNSDYSAMRVRVLRQVHYSLTNQKSIDLVLLEMGVEALNELFDSDPFIQADFVGLVTHVKGRVAEDEHIQAQRFANTGKQFLPSPGLATAVVSAIVAARKNKGTMADELFDDRQKLAQFATIIAQLLFRGNEAA